MIRLAEESDLVKINDLFFELQGSLQHLRVIKMSKDKMVNRFSKTDLKNIFVAQENDLLVGFVRISELKENEWCGMCVEVEEIFVNPKFEGKGIGQELMELVFSIAKKKYAKVLLMMHPKNERALDFYKKAGFETIGFEMCAKPK